MNCVDCEEAGVKRRARYLLFDDTISHQIKPLCEEHFEPYREHFGEDELEYIMLDFTGQLDESDLDWLLQKVNEKFSWYEDMIKRLYAEIDKLKKILKLDWFER